MVWTEKNDEKLKYLKLCESDEWGREEPTFSLGFLKMIFLPLKLTAW